MKEEEIMARRRVGNINSRRYRGMVERMIEHTLEIGPWITCETIVFCYWCGNGSPDHETDCVWLVIKGIFEEEA